MEEKFASHFSEGYFRYFNLFKSPFKILKHCTNIRLKRHCLCYNPGSVQLYRELLITLKVNNYFIDNLALNILVSCAYVDAENQKKVKMKKASSFHFLLFSIVVTISFG